MKTKPTKFKSAKQLIELWQSFCDDIVANNFETIPSQTAFCRWLATHYENADRKTIYNSLNKIFPDIKKDFKQIQSDVIAEGSMLGHYQPAMSIFALKNWCKWSDKPENSSDKSEGRLADLIEGLKIDIHTETKTINETLADGQAQKN